MGRRGLAEVLAHGSSNPYTDGRPLDDAWLQPSGKLKVPGGFVHSNMHSVCSMGRSRLAVRQACSSWCGKEHWLQDACCRGAPTAALLLCCACGTSGANCALYMCKHHCCLALRVAPSKLAALKCVRQTRACKLSTCFAAAVMTHHMHVMRVRTILLGAASCVDAVQPAPKLGAEHVASPLQCCFAISDL
jgi:hypothetical protein